MSPFQLELDPRSPVPLYHQIAEALRYRIATGAIAIGAVLPPLREAAGLWSVNLHTVRRAYATLAEAGIVETRAPLGTIVRPATGQTVSTQAPTRGSRSAKTTTARAGGSGKGRAQFLQRFIDEAREKHELSLPELVALLQTRRAPAGRLEGASVHVAECSMSQASDLAGQLEARWRVRAVAWPIDRPEPPPGSAIVATLFHYNDLRLRWPDRFGSIRFLAISPDLALRKRLLQGRPQKRVTLEVCERDESMLRNIAADVARILPRERFQIQTRLVRRPSALLEGTKSRFPLLVSPRLWGELPDEVRSDPRVHEVRYLFDRAALDGIGRDLGWAPREEV